MVQLWVNLPAREKMSSPRYQGLLDANIPRVSLPSARGTVRVIAGNFRRTAGSAKTFTPTNVWDVQLDEAIAEEFELPEGHTALIGVQSGGIRINETPVEAVEFAILDRAGTRVRLECDAPARLLVLAGEPIGKPVVGQGPFVMNTRDEITQAIRDYQNGLRGNLANEIAEI